MRIEGFTYVRNGLKMGYPFLPSINSVLPVVDQLFVVVGDSEDGTREAIENLKNDKIVIVDSIWEEEKRVNGEIFKDQANLGLQRVTGEWAIHIQADEVLSEADGEKLLNYIHKADDREEVDGLLFPFYHFWGDYQHIRSTRRTHAFEIRAFKNKRNVQSYRDSQGFRIFNPESPDNNGTKLKVLKTDIPIFHYAYTRDPKLMNKKSNYFHRFWHSNDWLKNNTKEADFDYNEVDRLEAYEGSHPIYMEDVIKQKDWEFNYDPSKSNMKFKDRILNGFERQFNHRLFEYKNYKLV